MKRDMNRTVYIFAVVTLLFSSCGQKSPTEEATEGFEAVDFRKDLESIKKKGKLKALTTYSSTSYFLYKGEPMGYEYELLQRFADHLDVDLEIIVADDINTMIEQLNDGKADIIAHGLTITSERKKSVLFTNYLYLVKQVLVQKKPDNWRRLHWSKIDKALVHDPIELIGDTISVRKNTSFYERIQNLSGELGGEIHINELPGHLSTTKVVEKVARGEIKYTVADDNIASINASYYPVLDVSVPISFSQRIAWAVRPGAQELVAAANEWIDGMQKETDYYVIYNKYFKNSRNYSRRVKSDFYSMNESKISKYDELIKKYAKKIGWDWRLLASLIYQESRFEPSANSWAKAEGLMQIMPATAADLGVTDVLDPEQNLRGGTTYLDQMYGYFESVEDSLERLKFTMASYNCGLGHVRDAQRLAEKRDLDPDVWEDNVEDMILALSYPENYSDPIVKYGYVRGIEPHTYVEQIFKRYQHYSQFFSDEPLEMAELNESSE